MDKREKMRYDDIRKDAASFRRNIKEVKFDGVFFFWGHSPQGKQMVHL